MIKPCQDTDRIANDCDNAAIEHILQLNRIMDRVLVGDKSQGVG